MRIRHAGSVVAVAAMTAAFPSVARPQSSLSVARPAAHEATVLRIDDEGILVDVGQRGVSRRGDTYRIYRPLVVRHPVTGRALHDRFLIGTVRIDSPGNTLSIAAPESALLRPAAVGDILVPMAEPEPVEDSSNEAPEPPAAPSRSASSASAVSAPPAPDPVTIEEHDAVAVWLATMGRTPEQRVATYQTFLNVHPDSRFAGNIRQEISRLELVVSARPSIMRLPTVPQTVAQPAAVEWNGPPLRGEPATTLTAGDPAIMAFQLDPRAGVTAAVLHVRRVGSQDYESLALAPDGDGYLRTSVTPYWVRPPGFEYFVEVVRADGHAGPAIATADAPRRVNVLTVAAPVTVAPGQSRIDLRTEYADAGSTQGRDEHFAQLEGDFLQRIHFGPLYGLRTGFGVYDSVGQPLCAYDSRCSGSIPAPATEHSSVVYGYEEFEFEAREEVHLIARVEVGTQGAASTNATGGLIAGFQARIRLGRERGTNLLIGGDLFGQVGQRAFFAFNLFPLPKLNILTQGEVFNQVVDQGDPMFRFISQVGYRIAPFAVVSLRGSYQLRNVNHGGFGGGLAVTFDW